MKVNQRTLAPAPAGVISFIAAPETSRVADSNIAASTDTPAHGQIQLK